MGDDDWKGRSFFVKTLEKIKMLEITYYINLCPPVAFPFVSLLLKDVADQ